MLSKLKFVSNGIYFRVLILVIGLAVTLVAAQFITNTVLDTNKLRDQRLAEAQSMTNIVARNLEKQFDYFELSDIEETLKSVRSTSYVQQVSVVDTEFTYFFDADPVGPIASPVAVKTEQATAMKTGKPSYLLTDQSIAVTEPLLRDGVSIGAVMIQFENPVFSKLLWPTLKSNLFSLVPILAFGILVAGVLVNQITRPLLGLAKAAEQFSKGDLDYGMPIEGPNEVRQLGTALSAMVGKLKKNIEQIYKLAYVDLTTQLPNREFFRKELTRAIRRAVRQKVTGGLLFVDLDGFKRVNDTHGHDAGDSILTQFSERLANVLRAEDLIAFKAMNAMDTQDGDSDNANKNKQMLARLGGDEFTVLLSEIREATDAATVSQRIIEAVSEPFEVNGSNITVGASVGIAIFPRDGSDYQTILKSADMAMYQAKEEGKNTYRYFSAELNDEASRRIEIERDLRLALEEGGQLDLHYQPKVDCATVLPRSAEALVRWKHPVKGMIKPLDFIGVAEDCGLILPLGKWVLEEACRQLKVFEDKGIDLSIAVNISNAQFERADLSEVVIQVLELTGANPEKLELELTESMAMKNPDVALSHMNTLKKLGVRFAIDDFGTGYSNLSELSRLPFDVFKIDRSFVEKLTNPDDEHSRVIVRTILGMANSLDYETVAEGVETVSQMEFLTEYGCTYAQGYYFARPMPSNEFHDWYSAWNKQDKLEMATVTHQGVA